jgi:hypothetical protein
VTPNTDGKATMQRATFRMECGVAINIRAKPDAVWALLTDATRFPRWNSTVQSIEGKIALGEKIAVRVHAAPTRTFKLKVGAFEPARRMVWRHGAAPMFQGVRTYTLAARDDGSTDFAMVETFSGLMLPMIAGSLPDFRPSFEAYAADLKREAERS